jgi:hypothetical protein
VEILIFKTDIANRWHVQTAKKIFNNLQGIFKWNVDVEDIDHVLRVEANNIPPTYIEQVLSQAGYYCEEMKD